MKSKIGNLLKTNWRILYGLYVFIYFPWFFTLEKKITLTHSGMHILNTAFDDAIPFIEWFIVPYTLWALYIVITVVVFYFKANDAEYRGLALSLIIGMSVALTICMIYPNGLTLRPDHVSDTIFGKMVTRLYASDTSTNVFPSIHVLNSLVVTFAILRSELFKEKKYIIVKLLSLTLCVLICLSTVFLKQHCIYDVLGAALLFVVLTKLIYYVDYSKVMEKLELKFQLKKKVKEYLVNDKSNYQLISN